MQIIRESPEHHFLTFLDKAKQDGASWVAIHCAQSETLLHDEVIDYPQHIRGKLHAYKKECEALGEQLQKGAAEFKESTLYYFTDGDLLLLMKPAGGVENNSIQNFYRDLATEHGALHCRYGNLGKDLYSYQRLADERLYSARRMAAYEAMCDEAKVSSIPIRRDRRKDTLVMIVEDDRFTAAFAANILNKDYEIIHAKTGEEGIVAYIEHAPDILFQDIHLPGLNGHETLNAIKKVDPSAHVVMLSGDTVKTNIVEASKGGAAGFLKKPFTNDRMIAMVKASPFYKAPRKPGIRQT